MRVQKRPLAFAGLWFSVTLVAVFSFGLRAGIIVTAITAFIGVASLLVKNKRRFYICIAAVCVSAVATGLYAADYFHAQAILNKYSGEQATVTAYVIKSVDDGVSCAVTAKITKIAGEDDSGFEISMYVADEYLNVGDEFTAIVEFGKGQNPYSRELSMQVKCRELISVKREKHKLLSWAGHAQDYIADTVTSRLNKDEGAVSAVIVSGQMPLIPADLNLMFARAGVSHILVVSGFHIAFIIGLAQQLMEKLKLHRYLRFAVLVVLILMCLIFYGFNPSVVRACVMGFIVYSAGVFLRRPDPSTSLGFAALVILLADPGAIADASFLLSFGCCFAMIVVYPIFERHIDQKIRETKRYIRLLKTIVKALSLSAVINLVTVPILIFFSMPVSLIAPLSNIFVAWLVPVVFVATVLMCVPVGIVANLFGLVSGLCSKIIIEISRFFASFAFASVSTRAPYLKIWIVFCAVLITVYVLYKGPKVRKRFVALCMALVLLIGILSRLGFTAGKPVIIMYNSDIVVFEDNSRALIVIDDIDKPGVDYLHSYLNYRYVDEVSCVIITNDIGRSAENHLAEKFPDTIFAAKYPDSGFEYYNPGAMVEGIERFWVAFLPDKALEVRINGAAILITDSINDYTASEFDYVIEKSGNKNERIYVIDGDQHRADDILVLYIKKDGSFKAAVE